MKKLISLVLAAAALSASAASVSLFDGAATAQRATSIDGGNAFTFEYFVANQDFTMVVSSVSFSGRGYANQAHLGVLKIDDNFNIVDQYVSNGFAKSTGTPVFDGSGTTFTYDIKAGDMVTFWVGVGDRQYNQLSELKNPYPDSSIWTSLVAASNALTPGKTLMSFYGLYMNGFIPVDMNFTLRQQPVGQPLPGVFATVALAGLGLGYLRKRRNRK